MLPSLLAATQHYMMYPDNDATSSANNLMPASLGGTEIGYSSDEDTGFSFIIRVKVVCFFLPNGFEFYYKEI